ncbi:MAG TPA: carnitine dehydratase, partial [Acidimicrobiaceae bacterium]|nr:carnitine dehydratase [Acidimicrobiaceae bacterium]
AELIDDPRFVTNTIRRQNLEELNEILEPAFAANTRAHWIAKLRAEDVPCGPINSLREALDWAIDMGMEPIFTGSDDYQAVRNPVRIDGEVITEGQRPPRLGEHTDEIRAEVDTWGDRS